MASTVVSVAVRQAFRPQTSVKANTVSMSVETMDVAASARSKITQSVDTSSSKATVTVEAPSKK